MGPSGCHTVVVVDTTYYELLGLTPSATDEEIRAAYVELAKRVHPDAGGNDALFRHVKHAYETLHDPVRRAAYDRSGYVDHEVAEGEPAPGWRRTDDRGGDDRSRGAAPGADAPNETPGDGGFSEPPPSPPPPGGPEPASSPTGSSAAMVSLRRHAAANPSWTLLVAGVLLLVFATRIPGPTPNLLLFGLLAVVIGIVGVLGHRRVADRAAWEREEMVSVDRMSDRELDQRLEAAFRHEGYVVYRVGGSGEVGADLVLDQPGTRTVVRVRRWDNMVGLSAVQEVLAGRSHYGAQNALVVTTSTFSRDALDLAMSHAVETWDRRRLVDFLAAQEMDHPRQGMRLLGEEVRAGAPSAVRGGLVFVAVLLSASVMASRSRRRRR